MANKSSLSEEPLSQERMQTVIAAIAPLDQEAAGAESRALDVITTVGLTMAEFVELEERPEQFGCAENTGWHRIIRNVLRQHWSPLTEALIPPFGYIGDQQIIYRSSREFQLMVSDLLSNQRANGSLTADVTRFALDTILWMWLERAIVRVIEDVNWYTGAPGSNFRYMFDECERDVRRARKEEQQRANTPPIDPDAI